MLDSVGAVLVQCVRDVYECLKDSSDITKSQEIIKGKLETGDGIGRDQIYNKEPSLPIHSIQHALSTFRNTGTYLSLLKKGGLPEEYWHLYEKKQLTGVHQKHG